MNINEIKIETRKLLCNFYHKYDSSIMPTKREKSKWQSDNYFHFFLAIVKYGKESHCQKIYNLLLSNKFNDQEKSLIDEFFNIYIRPFHKSYISTSSLCETSLHSSLKDSNEDLNNEPEEKEFQHNDLKKKLC